MKKKNMKMINDMVCFLTSIGASMLFGGLSGYAGAILTKSLMRGCLVSALVGAFIFVLTAYFLWSPCPKLK